MTRRHLEPGGRRKCEALLLALSLCTFDRSSALADDANAAQKRPRLTKAPRLLRFVRPDYPKAARDSGKTAIVTLVLDLDNTGKVTKAVVHGDAQPGFDQAARAAALMLQFSPAQVDGKPAAIRLKFRYRFVLKKTVIDKPRLRGLSGRVRWKRDGAPAAGVRVTVVRLERAAPTSTPTSTPTSAPARSPASKPASEPAAPAKLPSAATDLRGRFSFPELPDGTALLRITARGAVTVEVTQAVPARETLYEITAVKIAAGVDEVLVIRAPRVDRVAGASTLAAKDAREVPGVMGDALTVVQNLPGVARSAAGSGQLVVWGAAPADTRVYVDGVPIPRLYHRGGFRSVLHDSLVSSIELVPGAFGPAYGRGIGGVVKIETRRRPRGGLHGEAAVDVIDASAALSANGSGYGALAAGRWGYIDRVLGSISSDIDQTVPLSAYRNYAARVSRFHDKHSQTSLTAFGAFDDVERALPSSEPSLPRSERDISSFHRVALSHQRGSAGNFTRVTLWAGLDDDELRATFGDQPTRVNARAYRVGLRVEHRAALANPVDVVLGLDLEGSHSTISRAGTLGLPSREGDAVAFGQPPATQVATDAWSTTRLGLASYAQLSIKLWGDRLRLTPGLRIEPIVISGDRLLPSSGASAQIGFSRFSVYFSPRMRARWSIIKRRLSLHGGVGLHRQPPRSLDLSAVFGSTSLESASSLHGLVGVDLELWRGASLEVAGFLKRSSGLVMRAQQTSPPVAGALTSDGRGRTEGLQLVLRQSWQSNLSGWLSYAVMRSQRRDSAESPWRLFDFDQTHVMLAVLSWKLPAGFQVGLRVRASTGFPRTPVVGRYFDARLGRFQPLFGERNGERLPLFFQVDLHAQWTRRLRALRLTAYLDLLNVTNRNNAAEAIYSHDYAQREFLGGLPAMANVGVRGTF